MKSTQPTLNTTRYVALFQEFPQPLLLVDTQTTAVRDANAAACQYFNIPHDRIISLTLRDLPNQLQDRFPPTEFTTTRLSSAGEQLTLVQLAAGQLSAPDAQETAVPHRNVGRAKAFQEAVVKLSSSEAFTQGKLQETYRLITETATAMIQVERVGIWLLDDRQETLVCVDLYEVESRRHSAGSTLQAASNPAYFEAIRSGRVIDASDARTDPRTTAFTHNYLAPNNIYSLLDAGILVEGQVIGIICCEQTGHMRQWATDDLALAGALADQLATVLLNARQRATEMALLASEKRYQNLIANANDIIYTRDLDGNFTSINAAGERLLGYSSAEITHLNLRNIMPPEKLDTAEQVIRRSQAGKNAPAPIEIVVRTKSGKRRILEVTMHLEMHHGRDPEVQAIARDITERRELERQLLQSQKMDALGKLAGGVAHDFNNLLAIILSYSEMALMRLDEDEVTARHLKRINDAGLRAAELTRQLLTFSRNENLERGTVAINKSVTALEKMLRRILREDIILKLDLEKGLEYVEISSSHLDQIVMNLVINARDAMPVGGTITITTRAVDIIQSPADLELTAGSYVLLAVEDTGDGIDEETLLRIFEPFYTTKPRGKGTGLGLSTVYGIVKQNAGAIRVQSTPGQGTRFEIFLPLSKVQQPGSSTPPSSAAQSHHDLTILVVEDDEAVCQLTREALETRGFRVLVTTDQNQALDWCQSYPGTIDVLLTDVIMPVMSGPELAKQARPLRPEMQVVYLSGYTGEHLDIDSTPPDSTYRLIRKPFTPDSLTAQLRQALGFNDEE